MTAIERLAAHLAPSPHVYVQTHDFPDSDAVASAFALAHLLGTQGIDTTLTYEGTLQRDSLTRMINDLAIQIKRAASCPISPTDLIVIVDGCKGNSNVTDLIGNEIAVIDHHQVKSPEEVPYRDIRPELGACSSLIHTYYREAGIEPTRDVSSALLLGLLTDTALLTRGVHEVDIEAYAYLYRLADITLVNSVMRNSIQQKDLAFYRRSMEKVRVQDRLAFCYLEEGCNQNLLGMLGDFYLSLREVDFVLLCARNTRMDESVINLSARSERPQWNAAIVMRRVIGHNGSGGGHADMAGGLITDVGQFDPEETEHRARAALGIE